MAQCHYKVPSVTSCIPILEVFFPSPFPPATLSQAIVVLSLVVENAAHMTHVGITSIALYLAENPYTSCRQLRAAHRGPAPGGAVVH